MQDATPLTGPSRGGLPLPPTPTHRILRNLLAEISSAAAATWDRAFEGRQVSDEPTKFITVNGARFPVIRLPWQQVGDWFEELYRRSNEQFFQARLPTAKLTWNRRFRNLGGRIQPKQGLIELSSAHYEACGVAALGAVLIHEQIHFSLFVEHLSSGHTPEFKRRSIALGLPNIRHEMPLPRRMQKPVQVHRYACGCGRVIESRRRFRQPRACVACCNQFARGKFDRRFQLRYVGSAMKATASEESV